MQGKLLAVALVPHPPIMVREVAKEEFATVEETAIAMQDLAREMQKMNPDTVIIISPHAPIFQDAVVIYDLDDLKGDLSSFGAPEVKVKMKFDTPLAKAIVSESEKAGVYAALLDKQRLSRYGLPDKLDHGVVVPMSFFKDFEPQAVVMSMGVFSPNELYVFGIAMRKAIQASGKKVIVIASGDMSHKITHHAPAGYHPDGEVFDRAVMDALRTGDFEALFSIPDEIRENAGECGYRSLIMGLGALDGYDVKSTVLSYQAPFGVGYLVASFLPLKEDNARKFLSSIKATMENKLSDTRSKEAPPVKLARMTVEKYIISEELPLANAIDIEQQGRAGVFVSIKKNGQLRGCIGTIEPTTGSIAEEIVRNAISASTQDPRFDPVTSEELPYLVYSVDILTPSVSVKDKTELDPHKYGVIVRNGNKSGLLLPDLEGIETVDQQLEIALQKAGIKPQENYAMFKFEVVRYK